VMWTPAILLYCKDVYEELPFIEEMKFFHLSTMVASWFLILWRTPSSCP